MRFEALDFLNLDDDLTDEQRLVRDQVRRFVDTEVMPVIGANYSAGRFPTELVPKIAALGLLGAGLEGYGCAGVGPITYGLMMRELERGDSGLRSFVSVQSSLCMHAIYAHGSDEQKEQWLPRMATGDVIGCFCLTEPDFGSNPGGMRTSATATGNGYIIDGTKRWITNGGVSQIAIVWAKTDEGIAGFLVETDRPGVTVTDMEGKLSLRASVTSELTFDNVEIPADNRLAKAKGLKGPLVCLSQARYSVGWGALGAAMACYDEALSYAKGRVQFSRPIAGYQLVQQKLVHMMSQITYGQLLMARLGSLKEAGQLKPWQISLGKRDCVKLALDAARTTRDILGANGIMDDYQCARHMANLESVYTYEGTHDIHTLILGQHITGLAAFE
jgi:glutaryl-CoA dehydrogenase